MRLNQGELRAMYVSLSDMLKDVSLDSIPMFRQGSKLISRCKNGSGIHIKKENRGKFTASAKRAGQGVQEHARSVLNNPNATPLQKKRANFARNAAKWKHQEGGVLYNESLPEITVTPSKYQNQYFKEMRPYLDKKVATALAHDFDRDRLKYGDEIMAALTDIHKMSGKPRITFTDRLNNNPKDSIPRPYWVPVVNNIHSVRGIEDIISELAHPLQSKYGNNYEILNKINSWIHLKPYNADKGINGVSWYNNPSGMEYETHKIFEPMIKKEIYYSNPPLNEKEIFTKENIRDWADWAKEYYNEK